MTTDFNMNNDFLEKMIAKGLTTDKRFLTLIASTFQSEYFDNQSIAYLFNFCKQHLNDFGRICPRVAIINSISDLNEKSDMVETFAEIDAVEFDIASNYDYLLEESNNFLKDKAIKKAIIDSVNIIDNKDERNSIRKKIEEALCKDLKMDLGLDYFNDIGDRLRKIFSTTEYKIPTYFPQFDEYLNGGVPPFTFSVLAARVHGFKCFYGDGLITVRYSDEKIKQIKIKDLYKYTCINEPKGEVKMPSKEIFINKYGDIEGNKKYNEWKEKISKSTKGRKPWNKGKKGSIPWNKGKKGSMEGIGNLGYYIKKYGDIKGRKIYNDKSKKLKESCKNVNTLDYYIKKYGEKEGVLLYKEKNLKISDIGRGTLQYFIDRYGIENGNKRYELYILKQKISHSEEGYIKKFGEEKGKKKWKEIMFHLKHTTSLEGFISRHGEDEGLRRWKKRQKKWQNNLNSKPIDEIDRINRAKICNTLTKNGYSKISQELFWKLYKIIKNKYNNIYFAQLSKDNIKDDSGYNNEYMIPFHNSKFIFPDFFIKDIGKIIEFDGDYWHGEARGNQEKDKQRDKLIRKNGYKLLHVKERDYNNNSEAVINECLEFIKI